MTDVLPAWTAAEGAHRAQELFAATFGDRPAGVWAAPGRVNLIGEHTDYNDGLCLPLALPHCTFVALSPRPDRTAVLVSAQGSGTRTVDLDTVGRAGTTHEVAGWPAYVAGVAWAMVEEGLDVPGFQIAVDSCVPFGAGLSSSAAIECATAVALDDVASLGLLQADDPGRARLGALCVRAENEIAGAPTGGMDQAIAMRGKPGHALLLDVADGSARHVPLDLDASGLSLLVIDTRAPHQLVDGQYARRREVCEAAAHALGVPSLRVVSDAVADGGEDLASVLARLHDDEQRRRVRHVVTEIARVRELVEVLESAPGGVLEGDRLAEAGRLLDASHTSLQTDYEVSCPELDLAVETARSAGAHGARMTGGGFGGSAIALVDSTSLAAVADAVAAAFATRGFTPPAFLLATASAGAGPVTGNLEET